MVHAALGRGVKRGAEGELAGRQVRVFCGGPAVADGCEDLDDSGSVGSVGSAVASPEGEDQGSDDSGSVGSVGSAVALPEGEDQGSDDTGSVGSAAADSSDSEEQGSDADLGASSDGGSGSDDDSDDGKELDRAGLMRAEVLRRERVLDVMREVYLSTDDAEAGTVTLDGFWNGWVRSGAVGTSLVACDVATLSTARELWLKVVQVVEVTLQGNAKLASRNCVVLADAFVDGVWDLVQEAELHWDWLSTKEDVKNVFTPVFMPDL